MGGKKELGWKKRTWMHKIKRLGSILETESKFREDNRNAAFYGRYSYGKVATHWVTESALDEKSNCSEIERKMI